MSIKVKEIRYDRTFNLGNYENESIGFTIEIDETDDTKQCFEYLKQFVLSLSENNKPYKRIKHEQDDNKAGEHE